MIDMNYILRYYNKYIDCMRW